MSDKTKHLTFAINGNDGVECINDIVVTIETRVNGEVVFAEYVGSFDCMSREQYKRLKESFRAMEQIALSTPKNFTFYWRDGTREVFEGDTAEDALNRAGYGRGAIRALDFHSHGDCTEYMWDETTHGWRRVHCKMCSTDDPCTDCIAMGA